MKATQAGNTVGSSAPETEARRIQCIRPGCKNRFEFPYGRHFQEGQSIAGTCSKSCEDIYNPNAAAARLKMHAIAALLGQQAET